MRRRRAVSYLSIPIALLALAITGSCIVNLDDGIEGESGSEGEWIEEVEEDLGDFVVPSDPQNTEPPDDTAASCPVGQNLVPGDDNPNIIKNTVGDACIVTLGGSDLGGVPQFSQSVEHARLRNAA